MKMANRTMAALGLGAALFIATASQSPAEVKPAELPPAGYAGKQYVDSRGCAFLKAGTKGKPLWIPRVSSGGVPQCGFPPSGNRVPIAGEAGADTTVYKPDEAPTKASAPETAAKPAASTIPAGSGNYIVAVGSFGVTENADKAEARLTALGYPVSRGWLQGGSSNLVTVFAGPYESAEDAQAARTALHTAGFPDAVMLSL